MGSYEDAVDTLETRARGTPGRLRRPVGRRVEDADEARAARPDQPHWTVFELAGHFDISIGLTRMLIDSAQEGQPGRDRVSFFIFPRSEVAPVVYDYAYTMVEGKKPGDMPGVLRETFGKTIEESRATPPGTIG